MRTLPFNQDDLWLNAKKRAVRPPVSVVVASVVISPVVVKDTRYGFQRVLVPWPSRGRSPDGGTLQCTVNSTWNPGV